MALQAKLLSHCFLKSCSIVNFQNVAPILHSNLFEMNTASITNKRLLYKEKGGYKFMVSLETITFYCFINFINLENEEITIDWRID